MKTSVRDYFVFSKKERNGAAVLVVLSSVILFAPKYWLSRSRDKDLPDIEQLRSLSASLKAPADSASGEMVSSDAVGSPQGVALKHRLFRFDPNTISATQWMELGLSERTANTIIHYREKGGKFRSPEDLSKIWGMPADLARTLMPLVDIKNDRGGESFSSRSFDPSDGYAPGSFRGSNSFSGRGFGGSQRFASRPYGNGYQYTNYKGSYARDRYSRSSNDYPGSQGYSKSFNNPAYALSDSSRTRWSKRYEPRTVTKIDVNLADTSAFIALPGIGSKLAQRIITFREKLGGFYSVEQVGETFGLPDSTFQLIRPNLLLGAVEVKRLDINNATVDELRKHPYVRWALANAIVKYREAHGRFSSVDELQNVTILNPEAFSKLRAYLTN
jgi:competence protein ComEA